MTIIYAARWAINARAEQIRITPNGFTLIALRVSGEGRIDTNCGVLRDAGSLVTPRAHYP